MDRKRSRTDDDRPRCKICGDPISKNMRADMELGVCFECDRKIGHELEVERAHMSHFGHTGFCYDCGRALLDPTGRRFHAVRPVTIGYLLELEV